VRLRPPEVTKERFAAPTHAPAVGWLLGHVGAHNQETKGSKDHERGALRPQMPPLCSGVHHGTLTGLRTPGVA